MKAFSSYAVATVATLGTICTSQVSHAAASIVIVNADNPNQGFNDTTPATPLGGNAGITLGQQRLIAFKYSAQIWGAALDGSIAISIQSTFEPLTCTVNTGVLAVAGPTFACAHPTFPIPDTWYPGALGIQLGAGCTTSNPPIRARFNSALGGADCLQGSSWYYGLDGNGGAAPIDLVDVVLHEFAHGLGFLTLTDTATGVRARGSDGVARPDVWEFNLYDLTAAKHWNMMTDAERAASAIRPRKLVWDGPNVVSVVPGLLTPGTPSLTVNSPSSIAGEYLAGDARFGPSLTVSGVSGTLNAPAGPTTGCNAFPSLPPGSIALLDRGDCTFVIKVKNAQNAGAVAVVIADNVLGSPPGPMGGADPTINIPAVRITQSDGALLRQQLAAGVSVNERLLPARRGADDANRALLYTPDPYKPGSSVAHTDPIAGLLMDPSYNALLGHKLDLTPYLLKDIGWSLGNPNPQDQSADIALTLMPPSSYKKGSTVNYRVTVENNGPSNAGEVLVFSTAPTGVTYVSSSGDCVGSSPCSLGAMPVGTRKTFIASYSVSSSYSGDALLQLTMNAAAPLPDPVLSNNVATASTPQSGGCSSTGFAEPMISAALLLLAMRRRRRSSSV